MVEQARSLAGLVAAAGSGAVGALPGPVSNTAARLLAGLEQLIEEVPSITDELDVLVDELHAKRLSIKALSAELEALDAQLEVLERSLAPVQSWSHQWSSARKARVDRYARERDDVPLLRGRRRARRPRERSAGGGSGPSGLRNSLIRTLAAQDQGPSPLPTATPVVCRGSINAAAHRRAPWPFTVVNHQLLDAAERLVHDYPAHCRFSTRDRTPRVDA